MGAHLFEMEEIARAKIPVRLWFDDHEFAGVGAIIGARGRLMRESDVGGETHVDGLRGVGTYAAFPAGFFAPGKLMMGAAVISGKVARTGSETSFSAAISLRAISDRPSPGWRTSSGRAPRSNC